MTSKIKGSLRIAAVAIFVFVIIEAIHSTPRAQETSRPSRSVWDGVYTEGQAKRGEALYSRECARCHGSDLAGADEVPPLSGPGFLANWEGLTMDDLSERVRVSMPPNKQGKLTRQEIVDILSYVLGFNKFPGGNGELEPKPESLKQIRIEATKPNQK
ncbi:MAG TPA: cytochrome c [Blastocatellia bacterium]|nr:cytochrome c [Blastocatellia bacterium]